MPSLKELDKKTEERRARKDVANQGLGASQAFEYGQRSIEEKIRLEGLEKEILVLAEKLSLDVGNPPGHVAGQEDSSTPNRNGLLSLSDSPPQ
jgi:nucleoporin NUP82